MIQLGSLVKDSITGFKGIAIGRSEYLHGCAQILIKPQILKDGRPLDGEWIDEQRVELIKQLPKKVSPHSSATSGGPQSEAPRVR